MSKISAANRPAAAATDVATFIEDLDGGNFESAASVALSESAAAAVDFKKPAKITIEIELKPITGTHQVHAFHTIKYTRPTETGKRSEEATRSTAMHVGKFGKLTLMPESQSSMFDRAGQPTPAAGT